MGVGRDLEEVTLDLLEDGLELLLCCLSEDLLAEEIGDLMHHQLVEGDVLLAEKVVDQLLDEPALALLLLLLHLEDLFVDLVLEKCQPILVFAEDLRFLDQELRALLRRLQTVKIAESLRQGNLEVVLVRAALL